MGWSAVREFAVVMGWAASDDTPRLEASTLRASVVSRPKGQASAWMARGVRGGEASGHGLDGQLAEDRLPRPQGVTVRQDCSRRSSPKVLRGDGKGIPLAKDDHPCAIFQPSRISVDSNIK